MELNQMDNSNFMLFVRLSQPYLRVDVTHVEVGGHGLPNVHGPTLEGLVLLHLEYLAAGCWLIISVYGEYPCLPHGMTIFSLLLSSMSEGQIHTHTNCDKLEI